MFVCFFSISNDDDQCDGGGRVQDFKKLITSANEWKREDRQTNVEFLALCWNCAGCCKNQFNRFADRYLNMAANMLLIGTCEQRPLVFARSRKTKGESVSHKKTKFSVDTERTLSDHVPLTSKDVNGLQRVNFSITACLDVSNGLDVRIVFVCLMFV